MENITARTGWDWIKQGFALFKRQPAEMSTLFLSYMLLVMLLGFIPLFGQVLPLVLIPVFSIGFMQACVNIENQRKVTPRLLGTGFRSPALRRLLMLGLLYSVAIALVIAGSSLFDGGVLMSVMSGRSQANAAESDILPGMLAAMVFYIPAGMAFWHAAALVAWHDMPLTKALFYSFFAVLRTGRAFLVYVLGWAVIGIILPVLVATLAGAITGKAVVSYAILLPLSLLLTVVVYCSFYPTYVQTFGRDRLPAAV